MNVRNVQPGIIQIFKSVSSVFFSLITTISLVKRDPDAGTTKFYPE